jgi:acyl carrier protein
MQLFKKVDWRKECLFICENYPNEKKNIALSLAATLASIIGKKVYSLKPDSFLSDIADSIEIVEFAMALEEANIKLALKVDISKCTFTEVVESAVFTI